MRIAFLRSSEIYNDSRATKEITTLLNAGYSVDVYGWNRTGHALEMSKKVFESYKNQISLYFYSGNTGNNSFSKIMMRLSFGKWLLKQLENNADYSVVHSCDYDTSEASLRYCAKKNVILVYDIFDYYVDAHKVPGFLKKWIENREIKVINNSNATIICTEERRKQIALSSPKRVVVVHNSPEVDECFDQVDVKYDYVYCGGLNKGRLIQEIFHGYMDHCNYEFAIAGPGVYQNLAIELNSQFDNFHYFGSVAYSEVLALERQSRVISAIYDPSVKNHQYCAPNKFYEALALGKPLIVCKGTGIDEIVEKERIGIVIDYNVDSFYKAMCYLIDNEEEAEQMGNRGRTLYEQGFQWKYMSDRIIKLYDDLTCNN